MAQTSIQKVNDQMEIYIGGEPFKIKGATFGYEKEVDDYESYFKDLNYLGVNTIRTWGTGKNTKKLLDIAHAHDIKVMLGIWMRHGRPGMEADDSFDYLTDTIGKEKMYVDALQTVETYKNHPAVLMWGIGNEVYLNMETDQEKEIYSALLERICKQVKIIDPNHPIASVEAWTFGMKWWQEYVPSLDIYGINTYGPGANLVQQELEKRNIDMPYVITEFGVTGEWDAEKDLNGVKVEPSDQEKYRAICDGYANWIQNKKSCLGAYVFHYSNGDDFIAPWLFTHYRNMIRPQYWAIREAFTGKKPENQVPEISILELPKGSYESGSWIKITLDVFDPEQEELNIQFYYNQRTGSRKRRDHLNRLIHRGNLKEGFEIQMPEEHGSIKVYANVNDEYGNVGIATFSIQVNDRVAASKKYLVPKVSLPFYVYKDGVETPYIPSAQMGNATAIIVDMNHEKDPRSGSSCMKIQYTTGKEWYGIGLVDPPNDWGDILGGYDISGAKKFSFWAKANDDNLKARMGFGLIDNNEDFPDTAKEMIDVKLTTKWKRHTINLSKMDLSCIRSGFVMFSTANIFAHTIYLDDIVFE